MQKTKEVKIDDELIEKMFEIGAHYGYGKSRRHPSVAPFVYATKNKTDIINLERTKEMLEEASSFVKDLAKQDKVLLFVGTKPEIRDIVKQAADQVSMPYMTERWIGGTISNWSEIKKNLAELENHYKEKESGEIQKYTKKEQLLISKKIEKLERFYSGILNLKKKPDALFIIDAKSDNIAKEEARKMGIPVVALVNSDSNLSGIDYPILANDASRPSVAFFSEKIAEVYKNSLVKESNNKE